jgi:hypothetical protein
MAQHPLREGAIQRWREKRLEELREHYAKLDQPEPESTRDNATSMPPVDRASGPRVDDIVRGPSRALYRVLAVAAGAFTVVPLDYSGRDRMSIALDVWRLWSFVESQTVDLSSLAAKNVL